MMLIILLSDSGRVTLEELRERDAKKPNETHDKLANL
jgi:hypothetical protein